MRIDMATRLIQLAVRLGRGEHLTSAAIRAEYGVSAATAKRDLIALEYATSARSRAVSGRKGGYSKALAMGATA